MSPSQTGPTLVENSIQYVSGPSAPINTFTNGVISPSFLAGFLGIVIVVVIWSLVIKGFALWYSAQAKQKGWFIAMLIVNTLGILEIVYLMWFRPKNSEENVTMEKSVSPVQ